MQSINQKSSAAILGESWRQVLLVLLGVLMVLLGSSAQARSYAPLPEGESREYQLDAGDEIRITVFGVDAITNNYIVADDGTVTLPLAGQLVARGSTTTQLQDAVSRELRSKQVLLSPNVSIQLTKGRPFYVLGEVKKPGEYQYRPGMNVLTAIAVAGGFTFRANQGKILITRQINGQMVTGTVTHESQIRPGDTINVLESWF